MQKGGFMIISEKQLMCLIDILKDSLRINSDQFTIELNQRRDLYEVIVNQQSSNFKVIG